MRSPIIQVFFSQANPTDSFSFQKRGACFVLAPWTFLKYLSSSYIFALLTVYPHRLLISGSRCLCVINLRTWRLWHLCPLAKCCLPKPTEIRPGNSTCDAKGKNVWCEQKESLKRSCVYRVLAIVWINHIALEFSFKNQYL